MFFFDSMLCFISLVRSFKYRTELRLCEVHMKLGIDVQLSPLSFSLSSVTHVSGLDLAVALGITSIEEEEKLRSTEQYSGP